MSDLINREKLRQDVIKRTSDIHDMNVITTIIDKQDGVEKIDDNSQYYCGCFLLKQHRDLLCFACCGCFTQYYLPVNNIQRTINKEDIQKHKFCGHCGKRMIQDDYSVKAIYEERRKKILFGE